MEMIGTRLKLIKGTISEAVTRRPANLPQIEPTLVAVSKFKPKDVILEAYNEGQRHFGENYVQELLQKATDTEIIAECPDIKWHFIGHLQGNKVSKLISVPNLYMLETVDSDKLATSLNNAWKKSGNPDPLNIMIQVNTSLEESKSGVFVDAVPILASHIIRDCPYLRFFGLMTIGETDHNSADGPNPDFKALFDCRETVCSRFGLKRVNLALSMGMSLDYVHAIEMGSTNVRVGSSIFGERTATAQDSN